MDLTKTDDEDDEYASAEVEVNKLDENKKCERYESDTEEGEQGIVQISSNEYIWCSKDFYSVSDESRA